MISHVDISRLSFLFFLRDGSNGWSHISWNRFLSTACLILKSILTFFSWRLRCSSSFLANAHVFVLVNILKFILYLVFTKQSIAPFELDIDPVVNIIVTDEFKLVFCQTHEKHLQAHRKVILIIGNFQRLHFRKTFSETIFNWFHQWNLLVGQNTMISEMINQTVSRLIQIIL